MQSIGARYVKYVNNTMERTGTLWEGRYRACLVARDEHVMAACRYIDLNPVRAGLVQRADDYPWSSYSALAELKVDELVTPHSALDQLGTPRGSAYARWCEQGSRADELDRLREATVRELAFGSDVFRAEIEAVTGRRTFVRTPGRRRSIT
jgi:putative transposase